MKVDDVDELYVRWSIPQAGWSVLAIWFCHVFCARCLGWMVLQCVVYVFKLCFPGFCLTWCPRWKILDMYLWSRLFSPSLSLSFIDSPYFDFHFGVSKNGFVLTFLSGLTRYGPAGKDRAWKSSKRLPLVRSGTDKFEAVDGSMGRQFEIHVVLVGKKSLLGWCWLSCTNRAESPYNHHSAS